MQKDLALILAEAERVISGKSAVIRKIMTAMLAGGHILLDDVPGVGKTSLAIALSKAMDLSYKRIQFTPDVLPSDIVGFSVYNRDSGKLEYRPGVINSANLLLGDEINRTSSKTQSALLEAMEEGQITVDGNTYPLKDPFIVIATQNNVGTAGTQSLPYAQMDRFMVRLTIGYPDRAAQIDLLKNRQNADPLNDVKRIETAKTLKQMQDEAQQVQTADSILDYIADLTIASRDHRQTEIGLSPRAAICIDRMSKANAYMEDRDYVVPEDVSSVFRDVCSHRILLTREARLSGSTSIQVLDDILDTVRVPDLK